MKLNKNENDKSPDLIKKIKSNMNKTFNHPERFNSAFKQRPFTTFKMKRNDFDKKANFTKNNFYMPKLGRAFISSKYSTNNLYQNKHSFIWGKNKSKKQNNNKYYAKEELVERVMKLKKALNKLSDQNVEQKIKLNKQKRELKKQNEILNEVNKKYFLEKFFKQYYNDNEDISQENFDSGLGYINKDYDHVKFSKSFPKNKSLEEIKNVPNPEKNFEPLDNLGNISYSGLKDLYKKMVLQNERKDHEILILKEKLEHNRISNEALLSNMKQQYKQLMNDNIKKKEEIEKLKKNSKCTKYNEIMKEKEIFEQEMINIKSKFNKAMEVQENYKLSLKKIKFLMEEINSKDVKIGYMENKLKLYSKNSEINIGNLKNELNKKNKRLKRLENDFKKLNIRVNSSMESFNTPSLKEKKEKDKEKKRLAFEKQSNNFMILSSSKKNKENQEEKETNYVNHNMNFSIKVNGENEDKILDQKDNKNKLNDSHEKNINQINEKTNDVQNNIIEQNKDNQDNVQINQKNFESTIDPNPELLLIYVELTKRNINILSFINAVFSELNQENSNIDNKKLYFDYFIQYFSISDDAGKTVIENLSNREFDENKSLEDIKIHQLEIFNDLSNKEKKEEENEDEFMKKLGEIDENKFNDIILKYDDVQSGLVYYNQMLSIIKEINMDKYTEKILILTKDPEVFNLFNYQDLIDIINKNKEKNQNEYSEKKESEIIENNQEEKKENTKNVEEHKNNETSTSKKYEGEFDNNNNSVDKHSKSNEQNENYDDFTKTDLSEKILKNLAHYIVIEGSTPKLYINFLKEEMKDENNTFNAINPEKLFKFLEEKKIEINEEEKEEIIKKYGLENNKRNDVQYLDYDKFADKLFECMKSDDGISNDEDFMKNIKSLDIEGID